MGFNSAFKGLMRKLMTSCNLECVTGLLIYNLYQWHWSPNGCNPLEIS